jgi:uncharacterized protein
VRVEVVFSRAPRTVDESMLELAPGATVADALRAAGVGDEPLVCGVWGRRVAPDQLLRDGDRVELYRALAVDPMEARRRRHEAQKGKRPARAGR